MDRLSFEFRGKTYEASPTARFLVEVANGRGSYRLVAGYAQSSLAIHHFEDLVVSDKQKKRLVMFDVVDGVDKRTVLAR